MDFFKKGLLKSIIPMIEDKLPEVEQAIQKYLNDQTLKEGESQAAILSYTYNYQTYVAIVAMSGMTVTRQIQTEPLLPFVQSLISKL